MHILDMQEADMSVYKSTPFYNNRLFVCQKALIITFNTILLLQNNTQI